MNYYEREFFATYRRLGLPHLAAWRAARLRYQWTCAASRGLTRFRHVGEAIVVDARGALGGHWTPVASMWGRVPVRWDENPDHVALFAAGLAAVADAQGRGTYTATAHESTMH